MENQAQERYWRSHTDRRYLRGFLDLIRAKGYEIKGETFGENDLKYISFRPLDRERFARGSVKSLGAEYTRERIKERIEAKALEQSQKRVPFPRKAKPIIKDYSSKKLIDTSEEKFTQSPGLKHWADIQNLKIAAASYSGAGSIAELESSLLPSLPLPNRTKQPCGNRASA